MHHQDFHPSSIYLSSASLENQRELNEYYYRLGKVQNYVRYIMFELIGAIIEKTNSS